MLRSFGWDVPTPPHHGPKGYLTAASAFRLALLNRYAPVLLPCPYGLTVGARNDRHGYVRGISMKPAAREMAKPEELAAAAEKIRDALKNP